ncbi:RES domain-containing protein [Shewanella woodyi]|uniref:Uncharacterized protein n=1 Tax=Shewanella woodyi (strain ATCC 51908 / MS32) TaxID=392500 RepID=B1KFM7_SHEWM|nr:RES domain-containing protein [Shewanella woodyi]ACA85193.1 conserved hypothetical protein [Shewanella woodyi ATCC 51908]
MYNMQKPYSIEELKEKIETYQGYADYFSDPVFSTHKEWNGVDFHLFVKNALEDAKEYISDKGLNLGHKGAPLGRVSDILNSYEQYSEVVMLGLKGKRSSAYKVFDKNIAPKLTFAFKTFRNMPGDPRFDRESISHGYRIRTGEDSYNANYSRKDLFHIPFELNHLIGNNRFSLSGFPCLYMANSVYGAWEELNRPNIDKCFVSKFDLTKLSFIDLSMVPSEITSRLKNHITFLKKQTKPLPAEYVETFEHLLVDYLYIWPAILCCSFKVKNDSTFKPEYIFPQLFLEWLVSTEYSLYDGIRFLSTKSLALDSHIDINAQSLAKNYVIPARQYNSSGFCSEYVNKIMLTEPVNYAFHTLFGNKGKEKSSESESKYTDTVFGELEEILADKELCKVDA